MTIVYNSMQDFIATQTDDNWTHIGFGHKCAENPLHEGHEYLLNETKLLMPTNKIYASVYSDGYRANYVEQNNNTMSHEHTVLDKDYMEAWMDTQGVDAIIFVDDQQQFDLFNSPLGQAAISFVDVALQEYPYLSKCDPHDESLLLTAMRLFYAQKLMGLRRNTYMNSSKDGWYSYCIKHFLNTYCDVTAYKIEPYRNAQGVEVSSSITKWISTNEYPQFVSTIAQAFAVQIRRFGSINSYKDRILQDDNIVVVDVIQDDEIIGPDKYVVCLCYKTNGGLGRLPITRTL